MPLHRRESHAAPALNWLLGSALALKTDRIAVYEHAMQAYGDVMRLVPGPPGQRFELYCWPSKRRRASLVHHEGSL
jgi:hypothetical protein